MAAIRFHDEQRLARHILNLSRERPRSLVGIAGAPGSGKSTLARHLSDALGHIAQRPGLAAVVALDGFHLTNAELVERGLMQRKGSPETFRAQAFFAKLLEIKRGARPVPMPIYSRELHEPVPDAVEVGTDVRVVLAEGNYLFCDFGVWRSIAALFDLKVFVQTADDSARERVIARHVRGGMKPEDAAAKYAHNDTPNAAMVARAKPYADVIFEA